MEDSLFRTPLRLNRLNPSSFSAVRSILANFTSMAIWRGSASGGAVSIFTTVLARVCARAVARLTCAELVAVPVSTIVSPFPVTSTLLPGSCSRIVLRKLSKSVLSGVTCTSYCTGSPFSQTMTVVLPGSFALIMTSRGEMMTTSAIFGSAAATCLTSRVNSSNSPRPVTSVTARGSF